MSRDRFWDLVLFILFAVAFGCVLLSVSGCALFNGGSRVEARADYHIIAGDATVSLVAVGYSKGE